MMARNWFVSIKRPAPCDGNPESVSRRNRTTFNFGPRLVIHDDVVLYAGGDGKMLSISKQEGKTLWKAEHPNSGYQSPQDLLVVDGLVWCAPTTSGKDSEVYTGRDPKTGEVKKSFAPILIPIGFIIDATLRRPQTNS